MKQDNQPILDRACPWAEAAVLKGPLDELLTREWLLTNGTGGYASGTVIGCPTRRYHGLLIAARRPPLERLVCLSAVLEKLTFGDRVVELANLRFNHAMHPQGFRWLHDFAYSLAPPRPWVRWVYDIDGRVQVVKQLMLQHGHPVARLRYEITSDEPVRFDLLPFFALRDFHGQRRKGAVEPFEVRGNGVGVWLADKADPTMSVALFPGPDCAPLRFDPHPDWWFNLRYAEEAARGLDCGEDLFTPGWFRAEPGTTLTVELAAVVGADSIAAAKKHPAAGSAVARQRPAPVCDDDTETSTAALRAAAGQFVVRRKLSDNRDAATILAGYHWFGDWGRDAFIALPGLLLATGRHADAREVLVTFASAERDGLIPNRFSDYGEGCDYNSVDASLWFIHAADAYTRAAADLDTWQTVLGPVCEKIVERFLQGTRYNIHADADRLLHCGDETTQLTWMDAKCGDVVFTPRHGRPVEINALWHHALRLLAERAATTDPARAEHYHSLASVAAANFVDVFWNHDRGCLFDCVGDDGPDARIRPNQIFAVSLEHSPLDPQRQRAVVDCVKRHLLTPVGLRTLAPGDPDYRGRYEGDSFSRDAAYHQGTVWPWLLGPYIEACLRAHDFSDDARTHGRNCLAPLSEHLETQAGLGTISEIFDGDAPHTPRGCIAQAWSVAEILRATQLVNAPAPLALA